MTKKLLKQLPAIATALFYKKIRESGLSKTKQIIIHHEMTWQEIKDDANKS